MIHPRIRSGASTHTLSRVWSDGTGHWHEDADGRGAAAWDQCVADSYNETIDRYELPGACANESPLPEPPQPLTPPKTESEKAEQGESEQRQEDKETQRAESPEPELETEVEPDPEPEAELGEPTGFYEFSLELNAGWNFVHIPLELLAIDNQVVENETIGELFYALGIDTMYYHEAGSWVLADENTTLIRKVYQGLVIYTEAPVTKTLLGLPLLGNLVLQEGMNLVGIPRQASVLKRVSDLLSFYPEIIAILVEDEGILNLVGRAGDPGDIPITGGQAFGIISEQSYFTTFEGEPWGREVYE